MAETPSTYSSGTDLSLGQVPIEITDPVLYTELLDIHNAIETLLKGSDEADAVFAAFIAKFRNNTIVTEDYTITPDDGTIEIDASANDINITLPNLSAPEADLEGYRFDLKRIDTVPTFKVVFTGSPELVDGHASGVRISTKSSYTVKANDLNNGWNII